MVKIMLEIIETLTMSELKSNQPHQNVLYRFFHVFHNPLLHKRWLQKCQQFKINEREFNEKVEAKHINTAKWPSVRNSLK